MVATRLETSPAWTASPTIAVLAALCSAPVLCFLAMKSDFTGLMSDAPIYLLLADHFSPYRAGADWFEFLFSRYPFPPLYPIVLGWLGGGSQHGLWTHLLGALSLTLCVAVYVYWSAQQLRSHQLAVLQALVFVLMPVTLFAATDPLSEPLYLLLTLLGLILLDDDADRAAHWHTAALVIGLAAIVRTIGITAVAAFIIYWWLQTRGTRCRGAPFLALLPTLGWAAAKFHYGFDVSYVMSVIQVPLLDTLPALIAEVPANAHALWTHGLDGVDVLHSAVVAKLLPAALGFALIGLLLRMRDGRFDAIYVVLYFSLIVFWPHRDHAGRFLFSLVPLLLFYMTHAADRLVRRLRRGRHTAAIRALPLLLVATLEFPSSVLIVNQVAAHHATRYSDYARTSIWYRQHDFATARYTAAVIAQMFSAIRSLAGHVEAGACITSVYPHYTMLLTQRPSLFPATAEVEDAAFERSMRQCPYVLILNATNETFDYPEQYYPYDRLGDSIAVIDDVYYEDIDSPEPIVAAILARYRGYPDGMRTTDEAAGVEKTPGDR